MSEGPWPQHELWESPDAPAPMAAFRQWADDYVAQPAAQKVQEGVGLATVRRAAMLELMERDPAKALDHAVPEAVRRALPAEVLAQLEDKVDGLGDLTATAVTYPNGRLAAGRRAVSHSVRLDDGREFEAFVYGNRQHQPSRAGIPVHGIALDGKMAVSEWPGRILEPVEVSEALATLEAEPECPVSETPVSSTGTETAVVTGRTFEFFCAPRHARQSLHRAAATEAARPPGLDRSTPAPLNAASSGDGIPGPAFASQGNTTWTTGTKRIMVTRIRFSDGMDYTGGLTIFDCADIVEGISNAFSTWSYGRYRISHVGTGGSSISPILTMSKRADQYSDMNVVWNEVTAELKRRGLGSGYEILLVLAGNAPFSDPDADDGIATWGGMGRVGGGLSLLRTNGTDWTAADRVNNSIGVGLHEIGHNLGLYHASNIWNPANQDIFGLETGAEYGDRYDRMGSGGQDYNARYKQWLGWLERDSIPMATTSGIYALREHDQEERSGTRGLQVMAGEFGLLNTYHLFVEYRLRGPQPATDNLPYVPYDDTLRAYGAQIRVGNPFAPKTWLLDATPETTNTEPVDPVTDVADRSGNVDSPLLPGRTFAYSRDGRTTYITNVNADPSVGILQVEVEYGPIPGNDPPTGNITATTEISSVAVGQTVLLTANATDPEDADLAYHWQIPGFNASNVRPAIFPNERTIAVRFPTTGIWQVNCLVSDKHGGTANLFRSFMVLTNEPPSISAISDRTFNEDASLTVPFTVNDATTPAGNLNVSVSSSNIYLFPFNTITLGGSGSSRNLTMTPPANRYGTATVTVTVSDGGLTAVEQFNVTVRPVTPGTIYTASGSSGWRYWSQSTAPAGDWKAPGYNDGSWPQGSSRFVYPAPFPPVLGWTTLAGSATRTTTYYRTVVSVPALLTGTPTIRVLCDDGAVLYVNGTEIHRHNMPSGTITPSTRALTSVEGSLESQWVTVPFSSSLLVLGGSNTFAVEVHDAGALRGSGDVNFDFEFSTRQAPVVSTITAKSSLEDQVAGPYSFTATDAETPAGQVKVTGHSSNQALVLDDKIKFTWDVVSGARTISCTPQPNASGVTTISYRVSDGVAETWRSFTLTITPVNDPPQILPLPDVTAALGEAVPDMIVTVSDVDIDPAQLNVGAVSSGILSFDALQVLAGPTADTRRLRLVPRPGMAAQSTVTVSVNDGTTTVSDSFVFRVTLPLSPTSGDISLIRSRTDHWRSLTAALPTQNGVPVDFTTVNFDDSTWVERTTPCVYGEPDLPVTLAATPYRMTTYFRRAFDVPDPSAISMLKMRLQRDDGAVVYLNGDIVWSSNMPASYNSQTPASSAVEGTAEATWHTLNTSTGSLVPGRNVIAVEVHQNVMPTAAAPGDLRFDFELSAVSAPPPPQDVLVPAGDTWAYWDGSNVHDPLEPWTKTNFVDATWKRGLARLGYGAGGESTVINGISSGNPNLPNPAAMFRKWFDVADPAHYGTLHLYLMVDDGAAVFLNGNRVFEHNILKGALTSRGALSEIPSPEQYWWRHYIISPAQLVSGRNLIAVSVHQASSTPAGSDLLFDLQLSADLKTQPELFIRPTGEDIELSWSGAFNGWTLMRSTDLTNWTPAPEQPILQDGWLYVVQPAAGRGFFRLVSP